MFALYYLFILVVCRHFSVRFNFACRANKSGIFFFKQMLEGRHFDKFEVRAERGGVEDLSESPVLHLTVEQWQMIRQSCGGVGGGGFIIS